MFRACLARSSQAVASSSSASFIHTSAVLHAKSQKLTQKAKTEIKQQRYLKAVADRPSPVLGLRPEDEHKWQTCDLAKVLVNEKELESPPDMVTVQEPIGEVELPKQMAFGVTQAETETLFRDLPYVSATASAQGETDTERMKLIVADGVKRELQKAKNFAKVLDLRNADADGIAFENRRRIILAFSPPENPFDPGCSEVQAAILTYRIRNLWTHLTTFKRDVGNRRGLRKLVHQRAKILKYLRRTNRVRYDILLNRLALEPESVEGELIV